MSEFSALILFAPIHTLERHNDPTWNRPGRALYEAGSLKFLPGVSEVPLLVDHDEEREIGAVHALSRVEWIDGPWICASATIHDKPEWLRKGDTKASFAHRNYNVRAYTEGELVAAAFVDEVSVLSPSVKPREPRAMLWSLRAVDPAETHRVSAPAPTFSDRAAAWVADAPAGVLRRPGVGRILGVR